jgi:large subunit ribosomal protein L4e
MAEKEKEGKPAKGGGKKPPKAPKENQAYLYTLEGEVAGTVDLPAAFFAPVRTDLIRRAVTAYRANRRQPYGPSPKAGMRHAVSTWGKGRGVARVQRITGGRTAAESPGAVGGRRAHPPTPEKRLSKKMNRKERRLARSSALAATRDPELVAARGHRFRSDITLPVVVEDDVEELEETRGAIEFLRAIGVYDDVERSRRGRKVRRGRGTMRSRRYKQPVGPLVVLSNGGEAARGFSNLPGIQVVAPAGLNAELLAPGGDPGRLTIFSQQALGELEELIQ